MRGKTCLEHCSIASTILISKVSNYRVQNRTLEYSFLNMFFPNYSPSRELVTALRVWRTEGRDWGYQNLVAQSRVHIELETGFLRRVYGPAAARVCWWTQWGWILECQNKNLETGTSASALVKCQYLNVLLKGLESKQYYLLHSLQPCILTLKLSSLST